MNIDEYQQWATTTRLPTASYPYLLTGLVGEVGEFYSNIAKQLRDSTDAEEGALRQIKEMGDILWFISNIATEMEIDMSDVLQANMDKLNSRKARNTLAGSGDDR